MNSQNRADPLAEAKVYMAYGRHEQAAELLEQALVAEPTRADLQALLAKARAKSQGRSSPLGWLSMLQPLLAVIGCRLIFSSELWSLESMLGWGLLMGFAALVFTRHFQRRRSGER